MSTSINNNKESTNQHQKLNQIVEVSPKQFQINGIQGSTKNGLKNSNNRQVIIGDQILEIIQEEQKPKVYKKRKYRYIRKGHWRTDENAKYYLFLSKHIQYFRSIKMRRAEKIFKEMSSFVGSRTPNQCRSHHQKHQKKYIQLDTVLQNLYEISKTHPLLQNQPPFSRKNTKQFPYPKQALERQVDIPNQQSQLQLRPKTSLLEPLVFYEMPEGIKPISEKQYLELISKTD